MGTKKFLIVEDHRPTAGVITNYLRSFFPEWECTEAYSQQEGKDKITELIPDVVILDIALPDGDGLDLVRECAKPTAKVKPQFVVVTALGDKSYKGPRPGKPWIDQLEPEEKSYVTALLQKPYNWKQFLTALAKAGKVDVPHGVDSVDE